MNPESQNIHEHIKALRQKQDNRALISLGFVYTFLLLIWFGFAVLPMYCWLVLIPLMVLQWQLNKGTCLLTNLENFLLDEKVERSEQQGQFIKGLLAKFCKEIPSDTWIKFGLYGIVLLSWTTSWLRYLH